MPAKMTSARVFRIIGRVLIATFVLVSFVVLPRLYERRPDPVLPDPIRLMWNSREGIGGPLVALVVAPWLVSILLATAIFWIRYRARRPTKDPASIASTLKGWGIASLLVTLVALYWNWFVCVVLVIIGGGGSMH